MQVPAGSDVYAAKYKGAWLLFQIFHRSLAGNYVNFGVFELYGDPCLTKALDARISSQCASAVDNLAAYYFKHGIMSDNPPPAATMMRQHMEGSPQLLPGILKALFEIIVFEDCSNLFDKSAKKAEAAAADAVKEREGTEKSLVAL